MRNHFQNKNKKQLQFVSITDLVSSRSCIMGEGGAEWGCIPLMSLGPITWHCVCSTPWAAFPNQSTGDDLWFILKCFFISFAALWNLVVNVLSFFCPWDSVEDAVSLLPAAILWCPGDQFQIRKSCHMLSNLMVWDTSKKALLFVQYIAFWWLCLSIKILHNSSLTWG